MEYSKRIEWVDIAKAIAMFCIVFGHTIEKGHFLRQLVFSFEVPLFIFLSGVTFSSRRPYKLFLRDKLRSVMIPYWSVMLISILIFNILGSFAAEQLGEDINESSVLKYFVGCLYANPKSGWLRSNAPLWFLPCIFVIYNLLYWIDKWTSKIAGGGIGKESFVSLQSQ